MRLSRVVAILGAQGLIFLTMSLWLGWEASTRITNQAEDMARTLGVLQVLLPIGTAWLAGHLLTWFASPLAVPNVKLRGRAAFGEAPLERRVGGAE